MVAYSHKTHVNNLQFVPRDVKVDRKRPSEGEVSHFVSCAEDGNVMIWDSRSVNKEHRRQAVEEIHWKPYISIPLFRPDGTGEQGLSKILFLKDSAEPHFWAGSDEGDLIFVDWSKRPTGKEEDQTQKADFMISRESQRNYRPVLALEQSPFFPDLIMTVHDFNFWIWKIDLDNYKDPIFVSSYTFGSYNTCGVFSPTRAGVIFISKTNGIDVWDFLDQSHKASMSLGSVSSVITYITFQQYKHRDGSQYLAFGEENDGTIFLYGVPPNLKNPVGDEEGAMRQFWQREIEKCFYQKQRKEIRIEEKEEEEERKAKEEMLREQENQNMDEDAAHQKELEEEEKYQAMKLKCQVEFGIISQEEYDKIQEEKKKAKEF